MARRVSEEQKRAAALQSSRRMISRGERPGYRLEQRSDGTWTVVGFPGIKLAASGRREARAAARAMIATFLDVALESFDLDA